MQEKKIGNLDPLDYFAPQWEGEKQISLLKEYIHDVDLFLIMSVEPGYGGQAFMEDALERIEILKLWIKDDDSKALIEVDGGINEETGRACAQKGVDVLVAGSYVFKNDIVEMVEKLWKL